MDAVVLTPRTPGVRRAGPHVVDEDDGASAGPWQRLVQVWTACWFPRCCTSAARPGRDGQSRDAGEFLAVQVAVSVRLRTVAKVTYDCIVLLGTQPDLDTWDFPRQIHQCVQTTAELVEAGVAENIIVSGKWSLRVENQSLGQPFDECDGLADLLIAAGVRHEAISRERTSKDTISNLYYVKTQLLIPKRWNSLLFVVADFRIPRLRFLARKILGAPFQTAFEAVPTGEEGPSYNETRTMVRMRAFLDRIDEGDHEWLDGKFFGDPFYTRLTENRDFSSP